MSIYKIFKKTIQNFNTLMNDLVMKFRYKHFNSNLLLFFTDQISYIYIYIQKISQLVVCLI